MAKSELKFGIHCHMTNFADDGFHGTPADRPFLLRIKEAARRGRPMLRWVQLLISDTRAPSLVAMYRRPKSGKLLSVRVALCLPFSTSLWRRLWLAGLGRAQSHQGVQVANHKHVSLHHADDTKSFCRPCSRSWCRAWSCAWIYLPLCLGNASTLLSHVLPVGTLAHPLLLRCGPPHCCGIQEVLGRHLRPSYYPVL
jgi:hypothetical protein